jgi:hypothetical protein
LGERERSQSGELEGGAVFIYRTLKGGEKKSEIKNDRHRARFGYMMDNSKTRAGQRERERQKDRESV